MCVCVQGEVGPLGFTGLEGPWGAVGDKGERGTKGEKGHMGLMVGVKLPSELDCDVNHTGACLTGCYC